MTALTCKKCNADLNALEDQTFCQCSYCGSMNTLPKVKTIDRTNMYNRANALRVQGEFDLAYATYADILKTDQKDSEAYWGLVLSKYGIEYVLDPKTGDRRPTLHRLRRRSILADTDYQAACRYATNSETRRQYEIEAKQIEEIEARALAISQNDLPYDIFICYKEKRDDDNLTEDFKLANGIFYKLNELGYRVFFAHVSLQSILGDEYEPHIYSALNSAKVMLLISTKAEYLNSVWVKNEWSRFLSLMEEDASKQLIVCYRDINPYSFPDEIQNFQAQDFSEINALDNLVRNMERILGARAKEKSTDQITRRDPDAELEKIRDLLSMGKYSDAENVMSQSVGKYPRSSLFWFYRALAVSKNFDSSLLNSQTLEHLNTARELAIQNPSSAINTAILSAFEKIEKKKNARVEIANLERKRTDLQREIRTCTTKQEEAENRIGLLEVEIGRKAETSRARKKEKRKKSSKIGLLRFFQFIRLLLILLSISCGVLFVSIEYPIVYRKYLFMIPETIRSGIEAWIKTLNSVIERLNISNYYSYGLYVSVGIVVVLITNY